MEIVPGYKAKDGSLFYDMDKCIEYEALIDRVNQLMLPLGPKPKDKNCMFANGKGYIQHDMEIIKRLRKEITDLGNEYFEPKSPWGFPMIGRLFDDTNNRVLYDAWIRLSNVDEYGREWGQGYYATHPNEGLQIPFVDEEEDNFK